MEYEYIIDLEKIANIQNEYNNCCKKLDDNCSNLANSALANSEGIIASLYASIIEKYNKLKSFNGKINSVWGEYINGVLTLENSLASDDRLNSTITTNPAVIVGDLVPRKLWNNTKGPSLWSNNSSLSQISTRDMKIENILDKYNITKEQFEMVCAIVSAEVYEGDYEDAYAVINTIFNRTNSKWYVKTYGETIYDQAVARNSNGVPQFEVYGNGNYKPYLGIPDTVVVNAVIDFLTDGKVIHNYLEFKDPVYFSNNYAGVPYEQFTNNRNRGNKYHARIKNDDIIDSSVYSDLAK